MVKSWRMSKNQNLVRGQDLIRQRAQALIIKHGSVRAAGIACGINYSYLFRIAQATRTDVSDEVLKKLGLKRSIVIAEI